MIAVIKAIIQPAYLTTSIVTLYTVPANTRTLLFGGLLVNGSGNKNASVYIVPSGGTADGSNIVIASRGLGGNETYLCPELANRVMNPGDFIAAVASSATSVNFRVSGSERPI